APAAWTEADDTPRSHGAGREWYLGQAPPLVPRNAPFASVGELALVRGIDAAALARLRPFVAVADEHAVNPNTASREVLLAVVQDVAAVDRLLAERARRPLAGAVTAAPSMSCSCECSRRSVHARQRLSLPSRCRAPRLHRPARSRPRRRRRACPGRRCRRSPRATRWCGSWRGASPRIPGCPAGSPSTG